MAKSINHKMKILRQQLSSIEGILKQAEGYKSNRFGSIGSLLKERIGRMYNTITQIQNDLKNK